MKNKNVVIGMVAGGTAALALGIMLSPKRREKFSKLCVGATDTLMYGLYRFYDLMDKFSPADESEPEENIVNYKTHGKVNAEKSSHV